MEKTHVPRSALMTKYRGRTKSAACDSTDATSQLVERNKSNPSRYESQFMDLLTETSHHPTASNTTECVPAGKPTSGLSQRKGNHTRDRLENILGKEGAGGSVPRSNRNFEVRYRILAACTVIEARIFQFTEWVRESISFGHTSCGCTLDSVHTNRVE